MSAVQGVAPAELASRILAGDARALARGLRVVEDRREGFRDLLLALGRHTARGHRIGVTGSPGVGKSSLLNALIKAARAEERRVAIVAVDPSSPYSGGALLGDRLRMSEHFLDPGVFVRSMANRGALGGVSAATGDALDLFGAAGFDLVIVETVGAGQSEFEVASQVETTLVVLSPGQGDQIQAMKSGILEVGDFWVVNKADDPRAIKVREELAGALALYAGLEDAAERVLLTSSVTGSGVPELLEKLDRRVEELERSGRREEIRRRQLRDRMLASLREQIAARMGVGAIAPEGLQAILDGRATVHGVAEEVLLAAARKLAQEERG